MKALLELGVLCLLVYLTWAEEPVFVDCTLLLFRVLVNKNLFGDGVPVRAEELTLGLGCPVSREMRYKFELCYAVTECGIEFQTFETHVVYSTLLHYFPLYPVFGRQAAHANVSCQVSRQLGPKGPTKFEVSPSFMESQRKGALRMFPSIWGPIYWTPDLLQALEEQKNKYALKEVESRNWVSLPILTLGSVVCHGDFGLSAS